MESGLRIVQQYRTRWQGLLLLEVVLYALAIALLGWFLTQHLVVSILLFILGAVLSSLFIKPWTVSLSKVTTHIDHHLKTAEYSTGLLLADDQDLSGLALLQQQKVAQRLKQDIQKVQPKTGIKRAVGIFLVFGLLGFVLYQTGILDMLKAAPNSKESAEVILFEATDSIASPYQPPTVERQLVTVQYPNYTKKATFTQSEMNVTIVEGTQLQWRIDFNGPVIKTEIEGIGAQAVMRTLQKEKYSFIKSYSPSSSGYYNFRFTDTTGANYISEVYAIEVYKDQAPLIELEELSKFTTFAYEAKKQLTFQTEITDDFGVASAQIIATVTKGSGESVKFREETIAFDNLVTVGTKSLQLYKSLDLDALKMEPGDELYFYVEARDLKTPRPNIARSETYFAVIKDTITDSFEVDGTMAADLMPDYFRSQRQLIIDTEKLIKERPKLTEQEFKSRSNNLGFDQKALRLKYGQFMGDEDDSGIAVNVSVPEGELYDEEDPTAGFRHDHDDANEHNIVDHDHDHQEEGVKDNVDKEEKSLLDDYLHNHDDPEESTLFTISLRNKLQQAMAQMWDAELHLRLADPQTSLPYQYKALKLIQEIKNSARIYVHRIGFDPPPIKEDKRLSGDLEEVRSFYKRESVLVEDPSYAMRAAIEILEIRLTTTTSLSTKDKEVLRDAGEELATLAIEQPGKHLETLQQLKRLTEAKEQPRSVWRFVQQGLLKALPKAYNDPSISRNYQSALDKLLMKELQVND